MSYYPKCTLCGAYLSGEGTALNCPNCQPAIKVNMVGEIMYADPDYQLLSKHEDENVKLRAIIDDYIRYKYIQNISSYCSMCECPSSECDHPMFMGCALALRECPTLDDVAADILGDLKQGDIHE